MSEIVSILIRRKFRTNENVGLYVFTVHGYDFCHIFQLALPPTGSPQPSLWHVTSSFRYRIYKDLTGSSQFRLFIVSHLTSDVLDLYREFPLKMIKLFNIWQIYTLSMRCMHHSGAQLRGGGAWGPLRCLPAPPSQKLCVLIKFVIKDRVINTVTPQNSYAPAITPYLRCCFTI